MPELPEVITIRNDLRKEIVGKKVVKITPAQEEFEKSVKNSVVEEVTNVAKLLVIKLSSGKYITTHLAMTGNLLFNTKDPYIKTTLEFESGDKLHYSSVRMFGFFEVWNEEKLQEYKEKHGKTPLNEDLSVEEFTKTLKNKRTNIKNALLDQKLVSGIGNIYANDALYMSRIHPKRKTIDISDENYAKLYENVKMILLEGIKNRGSSIDRYRDIYGKPGTQQKHFRIYGKTGKKCDICKETVVFEKINGRGTFFCNNCQPFDDQIKLL